MPTTTAPSKKPNRAREILTIGYEGRTLPGLIDTLAAAQVDLLLDVRERAQSRKRGFSKSALALALGKAGLRYAHVRELGSPRALRVAGRESGDFAGFMRGYRAHLDGQAEHLARAAQLAASQRVCLLCFEHESSMCHRSEVASRLGAALRGRIRHL